MKLLAVSDKESSTLLNWIELAGPDLGALDLIVSCGDLSRDYLEFISTALGKDLVLIKGNHDPKPRWGTEGFSGPRPLFQGSVYEEKFEGLKDIHGRFFFFGDWVFVGFEGSFWYNGEGPQYTEEEMSKVVRHVEHRLRFHKLADWFRGAAKKVVVISHAPLAGIHDGKDLCHRGFQCFHHLLKSFSPVLWIHGHTATESLTQNQMSLCERTLVVNAYEHKFISLEEGRPPLVSYKPSVLSEVV